MPSICEHTNCWIKVGEELYGPVTCELEEDAGSPSPQTKHGWGGTLTFDPGAKQMSMGLSFREDDAVLVLDDGRQGRIFIGDSRITQGRRSNSSIKFFGQSVLSKDMSDED